LAGAAGGEVGSEVSTEVASSLVASSQEAGLSAGSSSRTFGAYGGKTRFFAALFKWVMNALWKLLCLIVTKIANSKAFPCPLLIVLAALKIILTILTWIPVVNVFAEALLSVWPTEQQVRKFRGIFFFKKISRNFPQ
jgi:hypothetical protein